jgi:hypothetical protein
MPIFAIEQTSLMCKPGSASVSLACGQDARSSQIEVPTSLDLLSFLTGVKQGYRQWKTISPKRLFEIRRADASKTL